MIFQSYFFSDFTIFLSCCSTFTVHSLQALLRELKLKEDRSLKSAEHMLAVKQLLVRRYQVSVQHCSIVPPPSKMYSIVGHLATTRSVRLSVCPTIRPSVSLTHVIIRGGLKMRERKMRYGRNCKGGKCRSKPYGTPSRDCIEKALSYFVRFVP